MKRLVRGLVLVGSVLSLAAACGGSFNVYYEGAPRGKRSRGSVAVYDIDCPDMVKSLSECTFNGAPAPWQPIGVFRVPPKALGKWGKYMQRVVDVAADNGCPAVAFRKSPPPSSNGEAVGAFCVDPQGGGSAPHPGADQGGGNLGPGIGVSATATITLPECNGGSECPPGSKCVRGSCQPG